MQEQEKYECHAFHLSGSKHFMRRSKIISDIAGL